MDDVGFKDIVPLLVGLAVSLSTLTAVLVTSYFNMRMAKINIASQDSIRLRELRVGKLEELYYLFDNWQIFCASTYLTYYRCYLGKISYDEVLKLVEEKKSTAVVDHRKYMMILNVHFPTLAQDYKRVDSARSEAVQFLTDPKVSKLSHIAFLDVQKKFDAECKLFKEKISSLAHSILKS